MYESPQIQNTLFLFNTYVNSRDNSSERENVTFRKTVDYLRKSERK